MEWKKPCAIALGSLVLFGLGGLAGAYVKDPVIQEVNVPEIVIQEKLVEFPVEVQVPVEVPVEVGSEDLKMVLDNLYEYKGDLSFIDFDDIDDDEKDKIIKYLDFVNQAKIMAIDYLEEEAFDELDGENYPESGDEFDEDELEDLDIEDDLFKIGIVKVDYEDGDARISVPFKFEDEDGREFKAIANIKIKDFKVDEMDINDIVDISR